MVTETLSDGLDSEVQPAEEISKATPEKTNEPGQKAETKPAETKPEVKPEVKTTFTKEQEDAIAKRIEEAVGKASSHWQKVVDKNTQKARDEAARLARENAELKGRQDDEKFLAEAGNTAEAQAIITARKQLREREAQVNSQSQTVEEAKTVQALDQKGRDAAELATEYGIDKALLLGAEVKNRVEMEALAAKTALENAKTELAELKRPPAKIDKGNGKAAGGPDLKKMTPEQKIKYGLEHPDKTITYSAGEYQREPVPEAVEK